ncbi:MAG: GHKL domain-containing protein [Chloroflexi bacterium]|nr:MAG: GHKL domain-containing protein [Chloroflexota bacterium]
MALMDVLSQNAVQATPPFSLAGGELEQLHQAYLHVLEQKQALETRVRKSEERRRALMHILSDLNAVNRKLADQRKAMIHILADYEQDRSRLARQTERLDNSRRALLHILQDSHQSNLRLENSRKAMIHIMRDLKETTEEVQHREQELRVRELYSAMQQVRKATEIISHLRTFGRAASVSYEPIEIIQVIRRSLSLMQEQLRLRQIEVLIEMPQVEVVVIGNAIQLEQVFINLLTNARDALATVPRKVITITCDLKAELVEIRVCDTGPGIPAELERRIFDPFFTTKEVSAGTGLGLSITYGIIKEHRGTILVEKHEGEGAHFLIQLPCAHHV